MTEYSFYSGAFTEYATFFIYASDILLILTLFFWLVFSKKLYKSFNIENLKNIHKLSVVWMLLLAILIWLIINTVVNNNYTEISAFYILKIIELSLLIIYIYFNLKDEKRLITTLFAISFAGFFQGLIAIYQFIYQAPLFKYPLLHRLTGESTVYPQASGIAKIIVDNEKFVRAYGTFPHPNILGGFLIVSIIISIYLLLKHRSYILSRPSFKHNNTNNNKSQVTASSSLLLSLFWIIFIFTQITALFFTFSRTAWMGFLLSLFIITVFYFYNRKIVSCETIGINRIVKSVIMSPEDSGNYGKFSAFATLRQAQGDILKFLNNKLLRRKLDNKIVSRETTHSNQSKVISKYFAIKTSFLSILSNIKSNTIKQRELFIVFLLTMLLIISYFSVLESRLNDNLINKSSYLLNNSALSDRIFYNNVSRETISENFIFGSGPGTFIFQLSDYLVKNNIDQKFEPWQYQPEHNVYLLIISEIGIVGFIILALFIIKIIIYNFGIIKKPLNKHFSLDNNSNNISIVSRETIEQNNLAKFVIVSLSNYDKFSVPATLRQAQGDTVVKSRNLLNYYLLSILVSFLFIGLFDHYFWTLQQGRLMFWLILGLILVNSKNKNKIDM